MNQKRIERARAALAGLTDKEIETLWVMVVAACNWQNDLVDAYSHMKQSSDYKHQKAEAKVYKRMRDKIFPRVETTVEAAMKNATSVSILDLAKEASDLAKKAKDFGEPE